MMEFLKTLLSLSVSGTILILILLLLKQFIRNKVSKKWQYYIWLIAIVRLLLPFGSEMSIVNQQFQKITSHQAVIIDTESSVPLIEKADSQVIEVMDTSETDKVPLSEDVSTNSSVNLGQLIQVSIIGIWLVVALILFIRKVYIYHRFSSYIKRGSTDVFAIEYLELLGNVVDHMNIKQTIGLYTNNFVSSPLLVGFRKASIILPTLDLSATDYYYTILHELTHYKRRDMFYKWLVQFTICLHWFNPVIHIMGREINRACELSCDEIVIKNLNHENMRSYGDTLLNAARVGGNYSSSLATIALFENKKTLKERFYCIMNYKKKTKPIKFIMVLMTLALCVGAISLGAYQFAKPANAIAKEDANEVANVDVEKISKPGDSIDVTTDKVDTLDHNMSIHIDGGNSLIVRVFYLDAYAFEIGWSRDNKNLDQYSTKEELKLSDQSVSTVYFDDSCKDKVKDAVVITTLKKLLVQIKDNTKESFMSTAKPVVLRTLYVGSDLKQVAEKYYPSEDLWVFGSVFSSLDSNLQKQYVNKAYQDDRIEVFAIGSDNLSDKEINAYAKKAYQDDRIGFFSVISDDLSKKEIKKYTEKAYKDDRINFFSVISDDLSKEEIKEYAEKAYKEGRVDFFAVISDDLSKEEIKKYAEKAYKDDRIDFFSMTLDDLSKEEIKKYAEKAYKDDRIHFYALLSNI